VGQETIRMRLHSVFCVSLALVLAAATPTAAQAPRDGRLLVTVVDSTGGVLPGATVTITGLDDATRAVRIPDAKASDKGLATAEGLRLGHYRIEASFSGFQTGTLKDVVIKSGDNKHVVVLTLRSLETTLTVAQNAQAAASDPRGAAFGSVLTREEIAALSDDPAEMAQQLLDMAGGNAVIKVDSFTGAPLPPKALIKSIHIVRDTFSAENHSAENDEIDIITQPGVGPLRGGASSRIRDGSMSGRSPFTPEKGPERSQNFEGNLGGTVQRGKSSFGVSVSSRRAFDTPNINIATGAGVISQALNVRRPNNTWSVDSLFDYALTRDQVLRFAFDVQNTDRENLGVGAYDVPQRAYSTASHDRELRVQHAGPWGRRKFVNSRLQVQWTDTTSHSATEARTIRVTDAFTTGGAQVAGGRHALQFEYATDVDYVRGKNSVRSGILLNGIDYRSDDATNYLGTFTFPSQAAFDAGQPSTFTQRLGNPLVEYWYLQAGLYVQDDLRFSKALTFSFGMRYEAQTHVSDWNNFDPRAGLTWAPFKSGRTTLRASAGMFHQWLSSSNYEQTLRVDGERQRDLTIIDPTYPIVATPGTVATASRYELGSGIIMPRVFRLSAGIDQTLTPKLRVSALYSRTRQAGIFRGDNLNAPVSGVRPNPEFANIIAVVSDAQTNTDQLQAGVNVNLASKAGAGAPVNWHRTTMRLTYYLAKVTNNSDGAFSPPPLGTIATEWADSLADRRHRLQASVTTTAIRNLSATLSFAGNTGTPYNITTGEDDNHDAIFNDRPAGLGRNTARMPGQWTLGANGSYGIALGDRRLTFSVSAENLTNHANYTGVSGVMTSPFFQQPTAVSSVRRITLGANFTF